MTRHSKNAIVMDKDTSANVKDVHLVCLLCLHRKSTMQCKNAFCVNSPCGNKLGTNCIIMNGHCNNKNGLWSIARLGCTLGCYSAVIPYQSIKLPFELLECTHKNERKIPITFQKSRKKIYLSEQRIWDCSLSIINNPPNVWQPKMLFDLM